MLELEAQVLQLGLHLVQSQSVGQRGIDVERFTGNLILFVGRLTVKGAHVMKTVAYLNKDHADVVTHREQQLLEVLSLGRSLFTEDTTADLGQTVNNLCDLLTEDILNVLNGIVGILHHIMKQGRADTCGTQSYFRTSNLCHGNRMHDIGLTRKTADAFMRLSGEVEGFRDDINLLSMS